MKLRKRFWRFTPLKVCHGVAPVLRFHGAGTGRDSPRIARTQGLRRAEPACCCPGPTQLLVYWELLHRHPSTGGVRIAIDRMDRQAIRVLSRLGDSLGTQARQVRECALAHDDVLYRICKASTDSGCVDHCSTALYDYLRAAPGAEVPAESFSRKI